MFSIEKLLNILFLDIETASSVPEYSQLDERFQKLWEKKSMKFFKAGEEHNPEKIYTEKAAIHCEFGRIVCVCFGAFYKKDEQLKFRVKSFSGEDELTIIKESASVLNDYFKKTEIEDSKKCNRWMCAHNGIEFDFPYLSRKCLMNSLSLPYALQVQGKRPWNIYHFIDTMDLWKFGDMKAYTSLDLLAAVLNVPSPKSDMDGSKVSQVFWQEKNYEKIKTYCQKDVITTAQILLRLSGKELLVEENIEYK